MADIVAVPFLNILGSHMEAEDPLFLPDIIGSDTFFTRAIYSV